jgi:segregation and condensation protein B
MVKSIVKKPEIKTTKTTDKVVENKPADTIQNNHSKDKTITNKNKDKSAAKNSELKKTAKTENFSESINTHDPIAQVAADYHKTETATSSIEETEPISQNVNEAPGIHSLKDMEEKILEKLEEVGPIILETKEHDTPKIFHDNSKPNSTEYKSRVEAILFAVGKYLDEETISKLCEIEKRYVKKALEDLKKDYDSRDTALIIVSEGTNWKINVREKYVSLVRKIVSDTELSKSIMETLAVIAWKSPIYQNEVVKIRGNKCYDHITELENAGFILKVKKGRSYVLKTTDKFSNYFDIDQKHLQGVMNEAKIPSKQTTLENSNNEEDNMVKPYSREKLLHALETIETKSIVQTQEDKDSQKNFLEDIHQRIENASKNTDAVVAEIPRPMHEQESENTQNEEEPAKLEGNEVVEKEEDIIINTEVSDKEHHFQKPEDQPQKPKSLTRKQLEKKFKDELLRVKEKSDSKK